MNTVFGLSLSLTAAVALVAGASPLLQEAEQSCSIVTPELEEALDAVHRARDGSFDESERAVKKWLPRANQALASGRNVSKGWLHLAVDLGRELTRLGRTEEAVKLFSRVTELDKEGDWGRKAATRIREIAGHP